MIRRSPTRIEMKLEDIQEFDYVQKCDKKKNAGLLDHANVSAATASKLLRQERIGFRSAGGGTGCSIARSSGFSIPSATSTASNTAASGGSGGGNAGAVNSTPETLANVTPSNPQANAPTVVATPVTTATSTPIQIQVSSNSMAMDVTPVGSQPRATMTIDSSNLQLPLDITESNEMDLAEYNNSSLYASAQMSLDDD